MTVLNDEQVRDVVGELAAHAKPGTVIAIHSTIEPDTAVELAEQLRPNGIHIVDAPVSGGGGAADKGELAVMVGADDEAYERVKPVFKQLASLVVHAGEPGAGTRMKLARNMLTFIGFAAACEAHEAGRGGGYRPAEAGPGGAAQRCAERRPRRDHGARGHEAADARPLGCTTCSSTPAGSARRI